MFYHGIKHHVLWALVPGPPQKHPPQISPPVCKIWRFLGPPPDPPLFWGFGPGPPRPWSLAPNLHDVLWFLGLILWLMFFKHHCSLIKVIVINLFITIYDYHQGLSRFIMHEVACLRLKGSSSEEYLTFTHHHGKTSLFYPPLQPKNVFFLCI